MSRRDCAMFAAGLGQGLLMVELLQQYGAPVAIPVTSVTALFIGFFAGWMQGR